MIATVLYCQCIRFKYFQIILENLKICWLKDLNLNHGQSQNKYYKFIQKTIKDPFNLAISSGLFLAAIGRPVSTLGFVGNAITNLAQSQTAILFLLIGLKIKFNGERPKLCLRLLLARHGFMSIFVSLFLYLSTSRSNEAAAIATRLAIVLSSHAASSIIAYGQMNKAVTNDNTKGRC